MSVDLYEQTRQDVESILSERPADEEALNDVLGLISERAGEELGRVSDQVMNEDEAWTVLGAVDAWASLASYAFQTTYDDEELPAVGTPFRRFVGAKKDVVERLREVSKRLQPALQRACRLLGALSYSISVGFQWAYL